MAKEKSQADGGLLEGVDFRFERDATKKLFIRCTRCSWSREIDERRGRKRISSAKQAVALVDHYRRGKDHAKILKERRGQN